MTVFVYIIKDSNNNYYCGITNNLERRINQHNNNNKGYTRFSKTWSIIYTEKYQNRSMAALRERQIKKNGVKRFYLKKVVYK